MGLKVHCSALSGDQTDNQLKMAAPKRIAQFDGSGIADCLLLASNGLPWKKTDLRSVRNLARKPQLLEAT
jgi:hypothetical protein